MTEVIRDIEAVRQAVDFKNMRLPDGRMPTDVDGFVELSDRLYVYYEWKRGNAELSTGQKRALTNAAMSHSKKPYSIGYVLIFRHNFPPSVPVFDGNVSKLSKIYNGKMGKWIDRHPLLGEKPSVVLPALMLEHNVK